MHIEVAEAKRTAFGPAKSFQPSTSSYLSNIEKSYVRLYYLIFRHNHCSVHNKNILEDAKSMLS